MTNHIAQDKRCFVISPIGADDSTIRENADDVFDFIIRPALLDLGVEAVRADKLAGPGVITEDMIAAILNYDFCIADLTGHNPNVFYELALAQAAERPVIILKLKGQPIPFDVKDYRLIEYDLKPRNIKKDTWVPILQEHVKVVLQAGYRPPKLLRGRSVSKADGIRSYLINARSDEFGAAPRYLDVVERSSEFCDLMGISLRSWGNADAKNVLKSLHARRIPTRILVMDDQHPGLATMINENLPSEDYAGVQRTAKKMAEYFDEMARVMSSISVRRLRRGMPHFQLIVTESMALVLQYMFSRATGDSPLQQFPAGTQLHDAFRGEFNALWEANSG